MQDPLDAVDARDPVLELDRLARRQAPQGRGPALAVVGMQQRCPHRLVLGHRPADQRLAMRAAVDGGAAAVGEDLERVEVIVHRLDHTRDGGVRGRQVEAHLALLGDVGDDAADLDGAVGAAPRLRAVVDPARDPVGTAQPVLDVGLAPGAELEVEGVIGLAVVGMDRRVPVDHVGIGLGPAQQPVGARALEELLQAAVAVGDRQVDVLADDVEQAREALAGLGGACVRLGADGDVGEDPVHAHAAVRAADRAGPVAEGPHHTVQAGHAIGRVSILAAQQPAVEPRVLGPVVGVDHRLPQRAGLGPGRHRAAEQPLEPGAGGHGDVAPVRRDVADVEVLLEKIEDGRDRPAQVDAALAARAQASARPRDPGGPARCRSGGELPTAECHVCRGNRHPTPSS